MCFLPLSVGTLSVHSTHLTSSAHPLFLYPLEILIYTSQAPPFTTITIIFIIRAVKIFILYCPIPYCVQVQGMLQLVRGQNITLNEVPCRNKKNNLHCSHIKKFILKPRILLINLFSLI